MTVNDVYRAGFFIWFLQLFTSLKSGIEIVFVVGGGVFGGCISASHYVLTIKRQSASYLA